MMGGDALAEEAAENVGKTTRTVSISWRRPLFLVRLRSWERCVMRDA